MNFIFHTLHCETEKEMQRITAQLKMDLMQLRKATRKNLSGLPLIQP